MTSEVPIRYLSLFAMPKPVSITGRSSSITNAFVNGVIPVVMPSEDEVRTALAVLGLEHDVRCTYCGDVSTEWDHLRPLVMDQRPTGYISEIHNLVPACGKCNQSKGNKPWKAWMLSDARLSPRSRGVPDLSERIVRLEAYEEWGSPTRINFDRVITPDLWTRHWDNHLKLLSAMREAEIVAAQVRAEVAAIAVADGLNARNGGVA